MDTDSFVLSLNTNDIFIVLQNHNDIFDLIKKNKNHDLFCNKSKKVIEKFYIESPKNNCLDEFPCLRDLFI